MSQGKLKVVTKEHPFTRPQTPSYVKSGPSVADLVLPIAKKSPANRFRVWINGSEVKAEYWEHVFPEPEAHMEIVGVPTGGDAEQGSDKAQGIRIAAAVAAIASSLIIGPGGPAALGPTLGMTTTNALGQTVSTGLGTVVSAIGATAVSTGISFAARSLIGGPAGSSRTGLDTGRAQVGPAITGDANQANPYGVIPVVLGKHRMHPTLAAQTFTETEGDDQYYRMLLTPGYGPIKISDIQIGDTPISDFEDVEVETREGRSGDDPSNLYSNQVDEKRFNIDVTDTFQSRTLTDDADEITLDLTFTRGLAKFDGGSKKSHSVTLRVEWKGPDTNDNWELVEEREVIGSDANRFSETFRISDIDNKGDYEFRVKRLNAESSDTNIIDSVKWTALRAIITEDPIQTDLNLALIALRIRATGQLQGRLDSVNCIVQSYGKRWNESSQTWESDKLINTPGAIYRHVLQHPANPEAIGDDKIDLPAIQNWEENNYDENRTYNSIIDFQDTVLPLLQEICSAGRAQRGLLDGEHTVVQDLKKNVTQQHFTPRNSWGFEMQKGFPDQPNAWRVKFINEEKEYRKDERLVTQEGLQNIDGDVGDTDSTINSIEKMEFPGVTDPDQIYRLALYHIAVGRLRPHVYRIKADVENLVCTRGDKVQLTFPTILEGEGAARVLTVTSDSNDDIESIKIDDKWERADGTDYSIRVRKDNGDSLLLEVENSATDDQVINLENHTSKKIEKNDLVQYGERGRVSIAAKITNVSADQNLNATIEMIDAAPEIHDLEDIGSVPEFTSGLDDTPLLDPPSILELYSDIIVSETGDLTPVIRIKLKKPQDLDLEQIEEYQLQWKRQDAHTWKEQILPGGDRLTAIMEDDVDTSNTYEIRVRTIDSFGRFSEWRETSHLTKGNEARPPDVQNLELNISGDQAIIHWDEPNVEDISHFEIRHSHDITANWDQTKIVYPKIGRTETQKPVKATKGIWHIRAIDYRGQRSKNSATVVSETGGLVNFIQHETIQENNDFTGTKTDLVVNNGNLKIKDAPTADGTYEYSTRTELGDVVQVNIRNDLQMFEEDMNNVIGNWESLTAIDQLSGGAFGDFDITVQYRHTTDGPGVSNPDWTVWKELILEEFRAQMVEYRVIMESSSDRTRPVLEVLKTILSVIERTISEKDKSSTAGSTTSISFTNSFLFLESINVTIQDKQTGDYADITNKDNAGFDIEIFDSSNTSVARTFDYVATGGGKLD